ncbi:MAG: D-arabinono-1,4-lactone oxidase [Acidimicrobiales bacterium]|nr:D-arabinono-1,4-lactone oxidase [Acidimicrobiales bacterium]
MSGGIKPDGSWRNWAGNQRSRPVRIEHPTSETDVVDLVHRAASDDLRVRVVGAGHSFTSIARTDDVLVSLDRLTGIECFDDTTGRVRVRAGTRLSHLNPLLDERGLAMPNLGDIAYQSVAGAISTSTHGTGLGFRSIAAGVVGLRLVAGDGSVVVLDDTHDPALRDVARVGLGALGVLTEVTLQCVPAFNLHAIEEILPVDQVLSSFDEWANSTDHVEFFWMPYTGLAQVKRNTRTDEVPPPAQNQRHAIRRRWKRFKNKELLENVAFGAMNHVGRLRPALIPRLNRMAFNEIGRAEYLTTSYSVFASERRVRFYEMEYAVPRESGLEAFSRVRALIETLDRPISFPIEFRILGGDDIPLSTAYGRDSCFIAVHVFRGTPYEQYFRGVEEIMNDYGGRPHWGKLHFQDVDVLAGRYPHWARFQEARDRLDPARRFTNDYLDRMLGL